MKPPRPNIVRFGRAICGDLEQAERREWWIANSRGAYAAGTIAGTLTRRYHGLLIAPLDPPLGRYLVFAKAEPTLVESEREWSLFANRWADGAVSPQGQVYLESFYLDGRMPVWRFAIEEVYLEMRVWIEPGAHTTYIAYRLESALASDTRRKLRVKLLVNARDHHHTSQPANLSPVVEPDGARLCVTHPNWFTLQFAARDGQLHPAHTWVENFRLPVEEQRGLDSLDSHLCVGEALLNLHANEWNGLVASVEAAASLDLEAAMRRFQAHDTRVLQPIL